MDAGKVRSEEPTEHHLAEARRVGDVVAGGDLLSGLTALATGIALMWGTRGSSADLLVFMRETLSHASIAGDPLATAYAAAKVMFRVLVVPLGVGFLVASIAGCAQAHGHFSLYALRFDFARILPFGSRGHRSWKGGEICKSMAKAVIVCAIAWCGLRPCLPALIHLAGGTAGRTLSAAGTLAESLGLRLALAAVIWGVADYLGRRYWHRRSHRMSREEIRRELKEQEGDPEVKAARASLRADSWRQNALGEVEGADVLVTGGTLAVALRYHPNGNQAPIVLCKGQRSLATKMMQVALDAGVPVCEDALLTAALMRGEEQCEIPESSHEAVARVFAALSDQGRFDRSTPVGAHRTMVTRT